jgi:hypothetical protein
MPIVFSCSCGKAMKAKDAFAGRKVKCPQCSKVLRIPERHEESEDFPIVPPAVLPPSARKPIPPLPRPSAPPSFDLDRDEDVCPLPPPAVPTAEPASKMGSAPEPRPIPPLAIPLARPVIQLTAAAEPPKPAPPRPAPPRPAPATPAPVHAWVDRSLSQQPTPWLPGDEARFQRGIKAPREGMRGSEVALLMLVVLVGASVAGWLLLMI